MEGIVHHANNLNFIVYFVRNQEHLKVNVANL